MSIPTTIKSTLSPLAKPIWAPVKALFAQIWAPVKAFAIRAALALVVCGEAACLVHLSALLAPHWSDFVLSNEQRAEARLTRMWFQKFDEVAAAHGYELKEEGPPTELVRAKISTAAAEQDVEPALARAVGHTESRFNDSAKSKMGAIGHMQVMPENAEPYGTTPAKLWKVDVNAKTGVAILRDCLDKVGGNYELALVCYNAGPGNLDKAIAKAKSRSWTKIRPFLPAETQQYVPRVMARLQHERILS